MNDTSPEVERLMRARYSAMSGEERFLIGIRMFDVARAIVISSLPSGLAERDLRREVCRRFYGDLADRVFPNAVADRDLSAASNATAESNGCRTE